ncbi:MAG TPA: chloride channel protein [Gammaproteobacteria bacterium]|nr:chloride channel protein [Gammaproteobacteria bacterium]
MKIMDAVKNSARANLVPGHLGDFTLTTRTLRIVLLACLAGVISTGAAWALLKLIGLMTNLAFYQRFNFALVAPAANHHNPALILLLPILGGLLVGLMARYGSEVIRGHGMPETIYSILHDGSKVKPRVAMLKPLSAAITIGTGGPFGAEGPIIMTGGAFGSLVAQFLHLTADERKTLLVAGAVAGMTATFNAPFASILLAVELLLFEWRPRSYLPVAFAVCVAAILRVPLLGSAPVFPIGTLAPALTPVEYLLCLVCGGAGALLAVAATRLIYFSEDMFMKLPIHWMWWPAIGGLIIGVGGLFEPRALGVGYDVIQIFLNGTATVSLIVGILVVKTLIWSLSLGSGTSGGVLAPIVMLGAALGSLLALIFPHVAPGFWALVCLAAVIGGVMRLPLTGVIFAIELTHDWTALLPLTISATAAFGISALLLKRSVLTEKVARKGFHLTREYSTDPLEVMLVREVMRRDFTSFRKGTPLNDAVTSFAAARRVVKKDEHPQRIYPVLDAQDRLAGIVTRRDMLDATLSGGSAPNATIDNIVLSNLTVCHPDMTLREVSYVLAESRVSCVPVVERHDARQVVGLMTVEDLLRGRLQDLEEERLRERVLHVRHFFRLPRGRRRRIKNPLSAP